ncbi:Uncharacterised protein [Nocardia otitidiscaviarum]|uniref:Uncharacterized protein n=1 Tax=Nocardia otitidiscaviarum TaxID=1823 RepID=A0A379JLQ3_9NOCA|nr:hypothetical protein [Nocardia otitidiscaviarum]SUD49532.1 Uncharacterised protein [Nocardia otitidiscaviarum]
MSQPDFSTRCPQRYARLSPVENGDQLECSAYHDHSSRRYVLITDADASREADHAWTRELLRIAALPEHERTAEMRAQRVHDVDRKRVDVYADALRREAQYARAWDGELLRIAALPEHERTAEIRAQHLDHIDRERVASYVEKLRGDRAAGFRVLLRGTGS